VITVDFGAVLDTFDPLPVFAAGPQETAIAAKRNKR
jgi:hypothetical protein